MPWHQTDPVNERLQFVAAAQRGLQSMTELCAQYGISRKTGYKLLRRFEDSGPEGLRDRSRSPHSHPNETPEVVQAALLRIRKSHPSWGSKKLLAYLTREAFVEARKCPDAIARVRYSIDIHNPDGSGTEIVHLPEGEWYEIPYGCVVPGEVDNLLVGGRPISVDHAIHSSMRVMPPACSVGQAAGLAAALAAQRGCRPGDLDGVEVRRQLIEQGAWL